MDFENAIADPASQLALSVFRLNGLLMRNGERITSPLGQSSATWQVLGRAGHGPQTVAQMARDMGLARQSVQRVADNLERQGLVAFRDNPHDHRTYLVEITASGGQVLAAIYEKNRQWIAKVLKRVKPEILAEASARLESLAVAFEALEKEEEYIRA